jgi:hypothetical protein
MQIRHSESQIVAIDNCLQCKHTLEGLSVAIAYVLLSPIGDPAIEAEGPESQATTEPQKLLGVG